MEKRRLGRIDQQRSVLVYGAASLASVDQPTADASISAALEAGIDHLDTAASYGESELRIGPWMPQLRDRIFLATKTGERDARTAWEQITASLQRLRTDHVDLLQIHAVCDLAELDQCFARGGVIEAVTRAQAEGLATWVGITGHTEAAPAVHAEALRRHDFDAVLTPLNPILARDPRFADGWAELIELVRERDVALRTIKAFAHRPWRPGEQDLATWYRPLTEQAHLSAALTWVLDGHPEVCGVATAGEVGLLERMVRAESDRQAISVQDAEALLLGLPDYASPFAEPVR